ncbi:MAG: ADP-dependent NAD(P)H-hydrate dehydratase / NAD(P)H-hydrate epimerase [Rugosibacter sp.]|nr:ADP-dependent NAD(P)H-hydrate dehydratase / NAD(P)H-hydrate epimerase [Rugosibacter sp.]
MDFPHYFPRYFPLLLTPQLRALEAAHAQDMPPLMARAGQAAAAAAMRILAEPVQAAKKGAGGLVQSAPVLIFAGPGNNGGDAFAMARVLHENQVPVALMFLGDEANLPPDAQRALGQWRAQLAENASNRHTERRVASADFSALDKASVLDGDYSLVVDGLFGIGLTRPMVGEYAAIVERINQFAGPVLALDIPSGLDADTGRVVGAENASGCAVRATHTISFIAGKPGLYTLDGPDYCGKISIDALGLGEAVQRLNAPGARLARADFQSCLKPRQRNTHKGRFGSLAVIGGARGMTGAALLAARAALHLGAGRVFAGLLEKLLVDVVQPELMLRTVEAAASQATAAVIGPGLGTSEAALEALRRVASAEFSLLLDADALNLLAQHPVLAARIARRGAPTLMTPHPAEAARLLAVGVEEVQANRVAAALEIAQRFNAHVALKGCGTVVACLLAHPDGKPNAQWRINPTGNAGLATGGTGDVLSGLVGALLAQGWPAAEALMGGVYLHGAAADVLVTEGQGPVGLTASELIPAARRLLNEWIALDV